MCTTWWVLVYHMTFSSQCLGWYLPWAPAAPSVFLSKKEEAAREFVSQFRGVSKLAPIILQGFSQHENGTRGWETAGDSLALAGFRVRGQASHCLISHGMVWMGSALQHLG